MDAQQDEILEFEALEQPQPQPQPPPEPEFLITVRFSNTDPGLLMVSPSTPISSLFEVLAQQVGLTDFRLLFDGAVLSVGRTVGDYGMEDGAEIHFLPRLVGDIGIWRAPDNVHPCLMDPSMSPSPSSDCSSSSGSPPKDVDLALLVAKLTQGRREDLTGTTVLDEQLERVLDPALCEKLRRLLDQRQRDASNGNNNNNNNNNNDATTKAISGTTDFKLFLTFPELCQHIGDATAAALSRRINGDYNLIALRRCEPLGHCIDFHLDHSDRVLQVALNGDDEYQGGRLVFATSDGVLLTPQRGEGTMTLHNCTVVHGVSKHTKGVRYGLFFIKEAPLQ